MSFGSSVQENNEDKSVHQMPRDLDLDGMDQDPQPSPVEEEEAYSKHVFN